MKILQKEDTFRGPLFKDAHAQVLKRPRRRLVYPTKPSPWLKPSCRKIRFTCFARPDAQTMAIVVHFPSLVASPLRKRGC